MALALLSVFRIMQVCHFDFMRLFLSSSLQALRVSMEEQRQRQEDEARRAAVASAAEAGISSPAADGEKNVRQPDLPS